MDTQNKISIKEAVNIAVEYLQELYESKDLPRLMLEEVELSEDGRFWDVTLGFDRERQAQSAFEMIQRPGRFERVYKTITIRADTGDPIAMKIRELSSTSS